MKVIFHHENHFVLCRYDGTETGTLIYAASTLKKAAINSGETSAEVNYNAPGKWQSDKITAGNRELLAEISLRPGGVISFYFHPNRKKYIIRKSGKYGGRFDLLNKRREEVLTLIPAINWVYRGHEYTIQVNEEYRHECSSLLILHAVHCTNCLLGIINGSPVPALVDI